MPTAQRRVIISIQTIMLSLQYATDSGDMNSLCANSAELAIGNQDNWLQVLQINAKEHPAGSGDVNTLYVPRAQADRLGDSQILPCRCIYKTTLNFLFYTYIVVVLQCCD
jgi:hypothetical protein